MLNDVGARIKLRRKELGYSAERLAEIVGVSPATIYRYENNDIRNMGAGKLRPIADALNTTPATLMGWTTPEDGRTIEEQAFMEREQLRGHQDRWELFTLAIHGTERQVRMAAALIRAMKAVEDEDAME